ncbi:hypothetical protein GME_18448 [Halomonas sp. TD01]|nr:hypothetical protein GME_18448 [Halomonas sp. TD01]
MVKSSLPKQQGCYSTASKGGYLSRIVADGGADSL